MTQSEEDPKGLIRESYRIEGITKPECRSIFLDWALSVSTADPRGEIRALLELYASKHPSHPMTSVLREGLEDHGAAKRRGGRQGRLRPT